MMYAFYSLLIFIIKLEFSKIVRSLYFGEDLWEAQSASVNKNQKKKKKGKLLIKYIYIILQHGS